MHSELQKCIVNKKIGRTLLHHFRIFVAEYSKRIKCIKNNVTIPTQDAKMRWMNRSTINII